MSSADGEPDDLFEPESIRRGGAIGQSKQQITPQESTFLSKVAAVAVTVLSVITIIVILSILYFQINRIHRIIDYSSDSDILIECTNDDCRERQALLNLERRLFSQRTERIQGALSSRLTLNLVAELVALTLIVLGGVLVFDRAQSAGEVVEVRRSAGWQLALATTFPGVILCALGTVTLGLAMYFPTKQGAELRITDIPVFIEDPNWVRNRRPINNAGINARTTTKSYPDDIILKDRPDVGAPKEYHPSN